MRHVCSCVDSAHGVQKQEPGSVLSAQFSRATTTLVSDGLSLAAESFSWCIEGQVSSCVFFNFSRFPGPQLWTPYDVSMNPFSV